jgi:hypothetical protein
MADAGTLIEAAAGRVLSEVPALSKLKLIVGVELRGRGDTQHYRLALPGPEVSKDLAADAPVRVSVARARFNELAERGTVEDWRAAFEHGEASATGPSEILKLVANVVERHEQRAQQRRSTRR